MVVMPEWMLARLQYPTQPIDTHSCVDPHILEVSGQRLPVVNEDNDASSRSLQRNSSALTPDITIGGDVDDFSAHMACSPPMVLTATLPSVIAEQTVNKVDANATSEPEPHFIGTHKVLAKLQNNTKPLNTKSKQMLSNHRLAKHVPAVQRGQVRPRDVSPTQVSGARSQMRPRTDFLSNEHRNQNQLRSEVAKAWALANFGYAMRREATRSSGTSAPVGDSSPTLSVLPPAPLPKPPARSRCQDRSQMLLTPSKASTLRKDNHWTLPKPPPPPPPPPHRLSSPPPAPP